MNRVVYIVILTMVCAALAFLLPAMPQPLDYHAFVDRRSAFGVPNFGDVVSNIGFLLAGIAGLAVTLGRAAKFGRDIERVPYVVFFFAMLLTAFGSSYYHLEPGNERLFWDRLPMTIAFMSLIAAQVVERVSVRAGLMLLVPMLVVGAASVFYWRVTERAGAGNVMPYGVLQGYSVIVLLAIAWLLPSRYTRGNDIYRVFAWYVIAKLLEFFDGQIFAIGHLVSGHSLKHLAAGAAGLVVCRMLTLREGDRGWGIGDSQMAPPRVA